MPTKKLPKIHVFFDTSTIFTKTAHDLFNTEIANLLRDESRRKDIRISWFIPDIVIKERRYQMQMTLNDLSSAIDKLSNLMDNPIEISNERLIQKIDQIINEQVSKNNIEIMTIDTSKVNWTDIIHRACHRQLPFSPGKNEKGFRDAMIAEIFLQFVRHSPKSKNINKIVFATKDEELKNHIQKETVKIKNISVITDITELTGITNTLTSEINESTIKIYQEKARLYFFDYTEKCGLYYTWKINDLLSKEFKKNLSECPTGKQFTRENEKWIICSPQFIKKNHTTIYWSSKIELKFLIHTIDPADFPWNIPSIFSPTIMDLKPAQLQFENIDTPPKIAVGSISLEQPRLAALSSENSKSLPSYPLMPTSINTPKLAISSPFQSFFTENSLTGISSSLAPETLVLNYKKKLYSKGTTIFELTWSVRIGTNGKLSHPRRLKLDYLSTTWDDL